MYKGQYSQSQLRIGSDESASTSEWGVEGVYQTKFQAHISLRKLINLLKITRAIWETERVSMKPVATLCHLLAPLNRVRSCHLCTWSLRDFIRGFITAWPIIGTLSEQWAAANQSENSEHFAGSPVNFYMIVSEHSLWPGWESAGRHHTCIIK